MSRLSFSRKLASSPSPRYHARSAARHASFAESAPLGRSAPCKNKNSDFFATFFRLGTLSCSRKAKQAVLRPIYCDFEPISLLCRSETIPNRKKVAIRAVFLFSSSQGGIEPAL